MKRTVKSLTMSSGTIDEFVAGSTARARKLDRGELLPTEFRLTFQDPADLLRVLSVERIRLLRTIRRQSKTTISGLAAILKRDRKAVSRDVRLLESAGLLKTHDEPNPGHGVKTIVEPLAQKYRLTATV